VVFRGSNYLKSLEAHVDMPRLRPAHNHHGVPSLHPSSGLCWPRSSEMISRIELTGEGVSALPRHLWCWVGQYIDVIDSAATLQCSAWLFGAFETEALWLHHCLTNRLARPVDGQASVWIYPFQPKVKVSRCIDWRRLLQANMLMRSKPAVWVRVRDVDLRLPVPSAMQTRSAALLTELGHVVSIEGGSLHLHTELASLEQEHERPRLSLRLRRMQWGGRPGVLVHEGMPLGGGHFLLEWSLTAWKGWPLPPTVLPSTPTKSSCSMSPPSKFRYPGLPVLNWLHAGGTSTPHEAATESSSLEAAEEAIMVRVLSLLVPRELWLTVSLDATLGTLYAEIGRVLRRESPLLADLCRPIKYHLMESGRPQRKAIVLESKSLRELFWAQSETVRVELESTRSQLRAGGADVGQNGAFHARAHTATTSGSCMTLLIWREQAFLEAPALHSDLAADRAVSPRGGSELQGWCVAAGGWARQFSEPASALNVTWSRQSSEPSQATVSTLVRQLSEPAMLGDEWVREVSEPPPLPSLPNSSWFPPSGHCLPDADASGAAPRTSDEPSEAGLHDSGAGPDSSDELVLANEGTAAYIDPPWERIVPHYPPQLLPRTLLTRQFEFHPTLPEVLLTGDKKGSVNVLNMGSNEVHPPLAVGVCPVLGLVWMRHYPQKAICGASHSGKIMFLSYDPNARHSEPALQRLQTVEEFPKLSSLSCNCTDDFLLASGISPNISVYDVQTGKVLLRAQGVHEHFINISRFCHNSPHIFATASFDHTCKVWDLRQPLLHDVPVKTLNTGSHNVMCVFSPDDKHVLCSGVDTRIMQFEVPSWRPTPEHFPLREPLHRERYRRSTYLATGSHFVTAATEESHMHVMSVDGKKLGVVDFRGVVQEWADSSVPNVVGRSVPPEPCCLQVPRLAMQLESRILAARAPWPFASPQHRSATSCQEQERSAGPGVCSVGQPHQELVQGNVQLDDADPNGGSSRNNHEFIQSIRTHPMVKNRVGVLLSLTQAEQSYVAIVDIDPHSIGG